MGVHVADCDVVMDNETESETDADPAGDWEGDRDLLEVALKESETLLEADGSRDRVSLKLILLENDSDAVGTEE